MTVRILSDDGYSNTNDLRSSLVSLVKGHVSRSNNINPSIEVGHHGESALLIASGGPQLSSVAMGTITARTAASCSRSTNADDGCFVLIPFPGSSFAKWQSPGEDNVSCCFTHEFHFPTNLRAATGATVAALKDLNHRPPLKRIARVVVCQHNDHSRPLGVSSMVSWARSMGKPQCTTRNTKTQTTTGAGDWS
jgi:hypothetical protein